MMPPQVLLSVATKRSALETAIHPLRRIVLGNGVMTILKGAKPLTVFPGCCAARSGALLIRGPLLQLGSRLCGAALRAAPRPGHVNSFRRLRVDLAGHLTDGAGELVGGL